MDTFIYFVVFLGLVACWQIIRSYELSEELRGNDTEEVTESDNRFNSIMILLASIGFIGMFFYELTTYSRYLLPEASSAHGPQIDQLFNVTVILISIVFVLCHLVLGWFAFKYFYKKGNTATFYTHNNKLEIIWTVIPTIVLFALIGYGLTVWNDVMYAQDNQENAQRIEIYGKQFEWKARYPGADGVLGAANYKFISGTNAMGLDTSDTSANDDIITSELHMVVDKPVHLTFRSQDIIHSAYLPHFRVQMNCVPGMVTQFAFTPNKSTADMRANPEIIQQYEDVNKELAKKGKDPCCDGKDNDADGEYDEPGERAEFSYTIICNKICGASHFTMKMIVKVESQEEYDKWLGEQPAFYTGGVTNPLDELIVDIEPANATSL